MLRNEKNSRSIHVTTNQMWFLRLLCLIKNMGMDLRNRNAVLYNFEGEMALA